MTMIFFRTQKEPPEEDNPTQTNQPDPTRIRP